MVRTVAIVPAAGAGKRLGLKTKKPFVMLKGKPLVYYVLKALNDSPEVGGIVIASDKGAISTFKKLANKYRFHKVIRIVVGGRTRTESVRNSLKAVAGGCDIILIHDGARPCLDEPLIRKSILFARKYGGCIAAAPMHDTVKVAGKGLFIEKTLDRRNLFRAQTPQAFRFSLIKRAYARRPPVGITDDASLVERLGGRVKILAGGSGNIKVTTRQDLKIAEALL